MLETPGRYVAVSGGEQSGKSDVLSQVVKERTLELFKPALVWLAGEAYAETEKLYDYILDGMDRLRVVKSATTGAANKYREIILIDGTKIKTLTVADTTKIGRERPDIIAVDEVAKTSLMAYYKLRARAAAGHGLLIMGGTFEGSYNWYPLKWNEWRAGYGDYRAYAIPSWVNHHVYKGGREDPEIVSLEQEMGTDLFMERIGGVPLRPANLVFGDNFSSEHHIMDLDYLPGVQVSLAIDPGYSRSVHALAAIQVDPRGKWPLVRVFDEIFERNITVEDMIDIAQRRPWWKDVKDGVIDIAGSKRLQGMKSTPVTLWNSLATLPLRYRNVFIQDGIDRMRAALRIDQKTHLPFMAIDPKVRGFLSELGVDVSPLTGRYEPYQWRIDKAQAIVGVAPKDSNNDMTKAITYWLIDRFGVLMQRKAMVAGHKRW